MRIRNGRNGIKQNRWASSTMLWVLVALIRPQLCNATVEVLRHQDPRKNRRSTEDEFERVRALAHLWEDEAILAQSEAERVLFEWHNIFNSLPSPRPTSNPTPPPVPGGPTRAPFPATARPTGPGGQTDPPAPTASPVATASPTPNDCLVGTTRDAYLLQQLSQVTSATLLTNPSTPQGRAFIFMLNDPLNPDVCTYPTLNQRFALASIYYSTNGDSWTNDSGWLLASGECTWNGVTCEGGAVTTLELGK